MLGRIETIEQFTTAVRVVQTGQAALYVGLFTTLTLAALAVAAVWRKDERLAHAARRGQYALFGLTALCCGLLYVGIFDGYYFVNYIERVTENNEEFTFKLAALWASQQGSLLFWCFILTFFGAVFAFTQRHNRTDRRLPWTLLVLAVVQFFFFFIMTSPTDSEAAQRSSPFSMMFHWLGTSVNSGHTIQAALHNGVVKAPEQGWELLRMLFQSGHGDMTLGEVQRTILNSPDKLPPEAQKLLLEQISDGNGMNPQLHNYWIAIHPPMLYLGFVGFTIPFAYAVGSLLAGEVGEGWLKPIRLWTMAAWGFLTVGIALGGLWAYEILGWGGYWAWDPVENASLIPWLTGTAFIHSVIVTERRGMLRLWSFALIIITYCMTVIGTFLVRTGIINSVHAFGATGDVDVWFYGFLGIVFLGSLLVLVWRAPLLKPDRQLDTLISREGSFLLNNLAFVAIALVTLLITFWPFITGQLLGEEGKHEFGQDAYVMINVPLFLFLLLLMGIGPALAWQRNTLRQMGRAFAAPAAAAVVVGALNLWWLASNDLLIDTERADRIASFAAWVRYAVQVTLWPICAFTLVCILMEYAAGARARMRSTGEKLMSALGRLTIANRRRYGGYIVHIGVLLIALGIYYSSFYESEGTVVTAPGGYSILENKLTGDSLLVVYERDERSESWDDLHARFGQDPEMADRYKNTLRTARMNPDKTAEEIFEMVVADMRAAFGEDLPPQMAAALPRMRSAVDWAVMQRGREVVYETFETTLRVYPYAAPESVNDADYRKAHDAVAERVFAGGDDGGAILYGLLIRDALAQGDGLRHHFVEARRSINSITPEEFMRRSGLSRAEEGTTDPAAHAIMAELNRRIDATVQALDDAVAQAVLLGTALPALHNTISDDLATRAQAAMPAWLAADAGEDFNTRRFEDLKLLALLHAAIEADTIKRRNEDVAALALKLPDERAAATLQSMRPLTLTGLNAALKAAGDGATADAIRAEITQARSGAVALYPGMRIFYDKRSGAPKVNEPIKDPVYHRTLGRDAYFILQDARADGTATFRFFIKPQMVLGLAGLAIITAGTALALLPAVRRRRVAA